jgi:heme-degrading monooxygenase HmoA
MIRVVIERTLSREGDEEIQRAMRDLRREAIQQPGYVSGETLRDNANPHHFVILSTWRSPEEWEAWANSDRRREVEGQIRAMSIEPERITVCEIV